MPKWTTLATVAAAMAILSLPAPAQFNPFRGSDFQMTDIDIQMASAAATKLVEAEAAALGDVETWTNPDSGNQGTVRLVRIFQHNDLPCRRLQHDISFSNVGTPSRFVFDRCRTQSGEWKFLQ